MRQIIPLKDASELKHRIDKARNCVITCHIRPDGDAIGSSLAFMLLLKNIGKQAFVVTPDQPPRSLMFLPEANNIVAHSKYPEYAEKLVAEADLIICCDFNKPSRQDDFGEIVKNTKAEKVLVDHHMKPDLWCNQLFSYPEMSSTCELVFRIICAMGLYEKIEKNIAVCLATGIITDTRNLSVNSGEPELYLIMYELMKKGVVQEKESIIRNSLMLKSSNAFRLCVYALDEKMVLLPSHKAAIITLSAEDLQRFDYEKGDTEGLVNEPLNIEGIAQSYLIRQDKDCVKISARSIGKFPVSEVCEKLFDGGGHLQAAGAEYRDGSAEDCSLLLQNALSEFDKYLKHEN